MKLRGLKMKNGGCRMAENQMNPRPHPSPLPRREGERGCVVEKFGHHCGSLRLNGSFGRVRKRISGVRLACAQRMVLPRLGERAGVRASCLISLLLFSAALVHAQS